ncbi:NAD(P)-dependent dehydrogenase, short-chain alcohol dehydrogenase family [Sphingobium faniae]|nr:NAD(P)-dependent dehydrogenase, short-chain alcohol dehydrogenase family [Sphingobium faniae]
MTSLDPRTRFSLAGKTALITGGSRGLGLEMARGFAAAGANLIIASRKLEACEEAARAIAATGAKVMPLATHVGDWDSLEPLSEQAWAAFGGIDVLVNNAGMSPVAPSLVETSERLFDKVIGVNLKGPFRLSALIGSRMQEGRGGSIINISSTGAIRPQPHSAPYAAAKAGLNAITIAFAFAYGPSVRVNGIMAGPFETDIAKTWSDEEKQAYTTRSGSALRRLGRPDEIVAAALYFASDASSYTSGAIMRVDGGLP